MRLLSRHASRHGATIHNEACCDEFLASLNVDLQKARSSDILIHGLRAQSMFAYVAASLGQCVLIKEEDAGEIYAVDPELRAPDYRLVMQDGSEFFVEVKNYRPANGFGDFVVTKAYLESLLAYARRFSKELYFAIYWPSPRLWTLVRSDHLSLSGEKFILPLSDAAKMNEMARLGDVMIGTLPTLTLKLYSNPDMPRHIAEDGNVQFTIGRAELHCGDNLLMPGKETEVGWFLLNFGDWPVEPTEPEVENGELISVGLRAAPRERCNPGQQFELVGSLSQMISSQYNSATAPKGQVDSLSPQRDPNSFGIIIPPDFKSDRIPLWRFIVQPSGRQ